MQDLTKSYKPYDLMRVSTGGGGAFAQMSIYTRSGDVIEIYVGQGGQAAVGQEGAAGGYGGGGKGGGGLNGGGGGGGGASVVMRSGTLLLAAAGGGGGGSTDYCCAGGGAGGAEIGQNGTFPGLHAPWPIADPSAARPTPVRRRYEYTSSACPTSDMGLFCLSEWDVLAGSLPSDHVNVAWGAASSGNYTVWATAGLGGGPTEGGRAGDSGSFTVRTTGDLMTLSFPSNLRPVAVLSQGPGLQAQGKYGLAMQGGDGAEGKQGGGGGGGGYWGGGGGGSGLDAAGGGGGSSYVNLALGQEINADLLASTTPVPYLTFVNESAIQFTWSLRWDGTVWGSASSFAVEMGLGADSEDFQPAAVVSTHQSYNSPMAEVANYTQTGLLPDTVYCFRVVPVFPKGRGPASQPLVARTIQPAVNYWEPVTTRRLSRTNSGRGLSNPVTDPANAGVITLPHLTPGVQIYNNFTNFNQQRFSDANTATTKAFPSPRRGHSLTLVGSSVYMFGGRSDGYSCALSYKDTLDLGSPQSGLDVYACTSLAAEVSELWALDIFTYQWVNFDIATSTPKGANAQIPPPREQHTAAVVPADNNIYIFGGRSRLFALDSNGEPIMAEHSDKVFGDFFRLDVPGSKPLTLAWPPLQSRADSPLQIIPASRVFVTVNGSVFAGSEGQGVSARSGECIEKVTVRVVITHPCFNQLRISLMGPGPQTGSPNFHSAAAAHEVLLYNQRKTNGTGCIAVTQEIAFDSASETILDQVTLTLTSTQSLTLPMTPTPTQP